MILYAIQDGDGNFMPYTYRGYRGIEFGPLEQIKIPRLFKSPRTASIAITYYAPGNQDRYRITKMELEIY